MMIIKCDYCENIPKNKIHEGRESVEKLRQKFQNKDFQKYYKGFKEFIKSITMGKDREIRQFIAPKFF